MSIRIYRCGNCSRIVTKDTTVCPDCGARLSGIRCTSCGFIGSKSDFLLDRCPKCGGTVYVPRADTPRVPVVKTTPCPFCSTQVAGEAVACPGCGRPAAYAWGAGWLKGIPGASKRIGIVNIALGALATLVGLISSPGLAVLGLLEVLLGVWQVVASGRLKQRSGEPWTTRLAIPEVVGVLFAPFWTPLRGAASLLSLHAPDAQAYLAARDGTDAGAAGRLAQTEAQRAASRKAAGRARNWAMCGAVLLVLAIQFGVLASVMELSNVLGHTTVDVTGYWSTMGCVFLPILLAGGGALAYGLLRLRRAAAQGGPGQG